MYQIQINEDTKAIYREDSHPEYIMNMEEQSENKALNDLPNVMKFLTSALAQDIDDLPAWLWNNGRQNDFTEYEKQMIQVIRYVLTDYHANCKKPTLNNSNERTPFCEYVIPIFK